MKPIVFQYSQHFAKKWYQIDEDVRRIVQAVLDDNEAAFAKACMAVFDANGDGRLVRLEFINAVQYFVNTVVQIKKEVYQQ